MKIRRNLITIIIVSLFVSITIGCGGSSGGGGVTETPPPEGPQLPSVTLAIVDDGTIDTEAGGTETITATLSEPSSSDVTIDLAFSGTATENVDYTSSDTSIVLAAGDTIGNIVITSSTDSLNEADETVIVSISSITNATDGSSPQAITITDDDAMPNLSLALVGDGSIDVEDGGTETVRASISDISGRDITVNLSFSGTATDTVDYNSSDTSIVIPEGSTYSDVLITSVTDMLGEPDETIDIAVSGLDFASDISTTQTISIIDDDEPTVTIAALGDGNISPEYGDSNIIQANLSNLATYDVTVNLAFSGTATVTNDYTSSDTSIVITAGNTTGSITITGVDDALDENDTETVLVDIDTVANGTEDGTQQAAVTIEDDDAMPSVTLSIEGSSTINENGGSAVVRATLSAVSGRDVIANLAYSGNATFTDDYTFQSNTYITVPAGSNYAEITINSVNNTIGEGDEQIVIDIGNVVNGTENGVQQETITITDDDEPSVTLSVLGDGEIDEAGGTETVRATLSQQATYDVTVTFAFSGTATLTSDYTRSTASVTITAGNTTGDVLITGVNNNISENVETVLVDIDTVTNGTEYGGFQQESIQINDDDMPTVTLSRVGAGNIAENGGSETIRATLSNIAEYNVTAVLSFGGDALLNTDFSAAPDTNIVIAAGNTTGDITITSSDDLIDEIDENILIEIDNVISGNEDGTQQVSVGITDDDNPPDVTLSLIGGGSIPENGGTETVRASLSNPSSFDVTVNLAFSGTAQLTNDYNRSDTSIIIAAGNTSGDIIIEGQNDSLDEDDNETVIVDIDSVTNGIENTPQQVTVNITDDDALPALSINDAVTNPELDTNSTATFTVTLTPASGRTVTVNFDSSDVTAEEGSDYTLAGGTLTFSPGETSKNINVTIIGDDLYEAATETYNIDLSGAGNATLSDSTGLGTINDDDDPPSVTLSIAGSGSIAENGGTETVQASLSQVSGLDVTVNLAFSGTALLTDDYTRTGVSILISAGNTMGSISIEGQDDTLDEAANETIIVDIDSITNGTEDTPQQVTVNITDDDDPPTVTLAVVGTGTIGTENGGTETVRATLSAASSFDVTVNLAYSGAASSGVDYNADASILIAAGNTEGDAVITSLPDVLGEADEDIVVDISSVTNGTENGTQQVTVTITDDDTPSVTLSTVGDGNIDPEDGGTETIRATLSNTATYDVTVDLSFSGTATLTTDYTRSATSILITAGSSYGDITLTSVNDVIDDDSETIVVDIDSVTNGTENGSQQETVTITDDDGTPAVTLSLPDGASLAPENGGTLRLRANLSNPSGSTVTVNLSYSGSATNVTDYTRSDSIEILPGNSYGEITIQGVGDSLGETNEEIIVDIDSVVNAGESGAQQVTMTITDDDTPTVTLSVVGDSTLSPEAGDTATIRATLSNQADYNVTVNLAYSGTAAVTSDYTRSDSIVVTAGNLTEDIIITSVGDAIDENNESIIIDIDTVTNGTENGVQQQTLSITDDDDPPSVTLSLAGGGSIAENSGSETVRATLSGPSSFDVTVNLAFSGTAQLTNDYSRSDTSIVISAGNTTGSITINSQNDALDENNETVIVDIDSVTNGTEGAPNQQTVTITDDDDPPTVTLSMLGGGSITENSGSETIMATLSAVSSFDVTVNLAFSGTATLTADYTRTGASIVISAGDLTGDITINSVNDALDESDTESVIIDVDSVTNGTEDGTQQVTVNINDDDTPPTVTLSLVGSSTIAEDGGSVILRSTLSSVSGLDVTVDFDYTGTATVTDDYTRSDSIIITAGNTSADIIITGVNDSIEEVNETVIADIVNVTNGSESGTQSETINIADDDRDGPQILSAEYYDLNGNGKIDHVKVTFDENVDDSTFDGYGGINALGAVTSIWAVSGYSNVRIDTRDSVVAGDVDDDAVIWLAFTEISGSSIFDTGAKPNLTATDSGLTDLDTGGCFIMTDFTNCYTQTAADIITTDVSEADKAAPIISSISGVTGTNLLTINFSEPVDGDGVPGDCDTSLAISDFNYIDNSGADAGNISTMGGDTDGCSDSKVTVVLDANLEIGDVNIDEISAASGAIFDVAGNTIGTTREVAVTGAISPYVLSVAATGPKKIRITFSEAVLNGDVLGNYELTEVSGGTGCAGSGFDVITLISVSSISGTVYELNTDYDQCSTTTYKLEVINDSTDDIVDQNDGVVLVDPKFGEFLGNERLKVEGATCIDTTSMMVIFNKDVASGSAALGGSESVDKYYLEGPTNLGTILSAVRGTTNLFEVTLTHVVEQTGANFNVLAANNNDGDGFDDAGYDIYVDGSTESLQDAPNDRFMWAGCGDAIDSFEQGPISSDPFGDDSDFGYLASYHGQVYIGPNENGNSANRFNPDGSNPTDCSFVFNKDTSTANSSGTHSNSGSSTTYVTMGHTGCTPNSADINNGCGPDNEDGRGLFVNGNISGTEYLFITGGRSAGDNDYLYWTTDTDNTLNFNFIDLDAIFDTGDTVNISGNKGTESLVIFNNKVYWLEPGDKAYRPYFVKLNNLNAQSQNGVDAIWMRLRYMTGVGAYSTAKPNYADRIGGTLYNFNDTLYLANNGSVRDVTNNDWNCPVGSTYNSNPACRNNGGIIRSTGINKADPGRCNATADSCPDWLDITPTNNEFTYYFSKIISALADMIPADRPIPAFAEYKGNLFMIRNACTTNMINRGCDPGANSCSDDVLCPDGNEVPQLWKCDPTSGASNDAYCDSDEWTLVDGGGSFASDDYTDFGDTNNKFITLLITNGDYLYVGFDNHGNEGVKLWRTNVANPSAEGDFEQTGSDGLGNPGSMKELYSSISIQQGSDYYIYVSAGNGGVPVAVYRQKNN